MVTWQVSASGFEPRSLGVQSPCLIRRMEGGQAGGLAGARLGRALHTEGGAGVSIQRGIGGRNGRDVVRLGPQTLAGWWKLS